MIAICAGLMRSGSVAMWQVMREIVVSTEEGEAPPLGTNFPHFAKKWAKHKKIYVTKLHRWHDSLEDYPQLDKAIAVLVVRDVRDVVVSLHYFRDDPDWETTLNSRGYKNYAEDYQDWLDKFPVGNIIVVKYEDFMADRPGTIIEVADFMGVPITEEEAERIDEKWNIKANKKRAQESNEYSSPDYMAQRHIRSGASRQWEDEIPSDLVSRIEDDHGEWLVKNGYILTGDQA
jgi:hypothetical protein